MIRKTLSKSLGIRKLIVPPTYFSTPVSSNTLAGTGPTHMAHSRGHTWGKPQSGTSRFLELGLLFSVVSLGYFAIDNFRRRISLEEELENCRLDALNQKEYYKAEIQGKFKKRELQILNERKNTQIKEMKMLLHIAMLKREMHKAGLPDSVTLQMVHNEFKQKIKMDNSISNISGVRLWLDSQADEGSMTALRYSESPLKPGVTSKILTDDCIKRFLPNEKEYEHLKEN